MAEWSKAGALKASEGQLSGGSNPSLSAKSLSQRLVFLPKQIRKLPQSKLQLYWRHIMSDIFSILFVLLICFIVFLVCRELNCWYWKVNRHIELLEEQNKLLKDMLSKLK